MSWLWEFVFPNLFVCIHLWFFHPYTYDWLRGRVWFGHDTINFSRGICLEVIWKHARIPLSRRQDQTECDVYIDYRYPYTVLEYATRTKSRMESFRNNKNRFSILFCPYTRLPNTLHIHMRSSIRKWKIIQFKREMMNECNMEL